MSPIVVLAIALASLLAFSNAYPLDVAPAVDADDKQGVAPATPAPSTTSCSYKNLNTMAGGNMFFVISTAAGGSSFAYVYELTASTTTMANGVYNTHCLNAAYTPSIYNTGTITCSGGNWVNNNATIFNCAAPPTTVTTPTTTAATTPTTTPAPTTTQAPTCSVAVVNTMANGDPYLSIGLTAGSTNQFGFVASGTSSGQWLVPSGVYSIDCDNNGIYNQGTITCSNGAWSGNTTVLSCAQGPTCLVSPINAMTGQDPYFGIAQVPVTQTQTGDVFVKSGTAANPQWSLAAGTYSYQCVNSNVASAPYNPGTITCSGGAWSGNTTIMTCASILPTTTPTPPCPVSQINAMTGQDAYFGIAQVPVTQTQTGDVFVKSEMAANPQWSLPAGTYNFGCVNSNVASAQYNQGTITCSGGTWSANTTIMTCASITPTTTPAPPCYVSSLNTMTQQDPYFGIVTPTSPGGVTVKTGTAANPSWSLPAGQYGYQCLDISAYGYLYNQGTINCIGGAWAGNTTALTCLPVP